MADDTPNDAELDELEAHIEKAREDAAKAVDAFADEPTETFVDSGAEDSDGDGAEDDDQTIAPPG